MKPLASLFCTFFVACIGLPVAAANFASEYELLRQLPTAALSGVITNTGVPDAQGFIGFHQQQGKWFESGAQRGGCWMLIGAVVAGDEKRADEAWRSIDTTFAHQVEDGGFLSVQRPEISHKPTRAERVETATGPLFPEPCEQVFRAHPQVTRCALIGLGESGRQQPALVIEARPKNAAAGQAFARDLRALALQQTHTSAISRFYFHPKFPVDVRHNAKIHRLTLARWAVTARAVTSDK